jgi:hypothetical protein
VDQLVVRVLAVRARRAPHDRPGVVADRLPVRASTDLPFDSMSSCCSTP